MGLKNDAGRLLEVDPESMGGVGKGFLFRKSFRLQWFGATETLVIHPGAIEAAWATLPIFQHIACFFDA